MNDQARVGLWRIQVLLVALCLLLPQVGIGQTAGLQDFSLLQEYLKAQGWHAERSTNGDVLLWPAPKSETQSQATIKDDPDPSTANESIRATDFDKLSERLRQRGWGVTRDDTGALIVRPVESLSKPTATSGLQPAPVQQQDHLSDLQLLLSASGWQVRRDHERNLLLVPQGKTLKPSDSGDTYAEFAQLVAASDALSQAGWKVEKTTTGDLLLVPKSEVQAQSKGDSLVRLPVSSSEEAAVIARDWLRQRNEDDTMLGRIRKVKWLYLVSLVTRTPPYRLKNQLVVRISDGKVIPIH